MSKDIITLKISRQSDGSYVILQKDKYKKGVDILSHHDTLDEAETELTRLNSRPSQRETLEFFNQIRDSMKTTK